LISTVIWLRPGSDFDSTRLSCGIRWIAVSRTSVTSRSTSSAVAPG